jgi:hypothetical protein
MKGTLVAILHPIFYCITLNVHAQTDSNKLNLHLNCGYCYEDFVKTELKFVNYVRDQKDADVDLLITTQLAGAESTEYVLFFIGQNKFTHVDDTLKYLSNVNNTEDETRNGLLKVINLGLIRYVAHTNYASQILIGIDENALGDSILITSGDKFRSWVFDINGNADLSGEKSSFNQNYSVYLSANKTTEDIKINIGLSRNYGESRFDYEDDIINSYTKSESASLQVVKSLNQHFSYGVFGSIGSGTYSNQMYYSSFSPALEYDLFPYSQSQRKIFTIAWSVATNHYKYKDTTIYDKLEDNIFQNRLSISLSVTQPWGSVGLSIFGSHNLNDFQENHLSLYASTDLRIFRGLSFNIFSGYELVHDQISLSKEGASETELLLHRKEIATSYLFSFSTGITYRFGSKFSNVVNPRLSGGG